MRPFIKRLKVKMTKAELSLCTILRELGLPYKFQRWVRPTKYVTDFWLPIRTTDTRKKRGLIIEVDGEYHYNRTEYDNQRTKSLLRQKRVDKLIRFKNEDVLQRKGVVKSTILSVVDELRKEDKKEEICAL